MHSFLFNLKILVTIYTYICIYVKKKYQFFFYIRPNIISDTLVRFAITCHSFSEQTLVPSPLIILEISVIRVRL